MRLVTSKVIEYGRENVLQRTPDLPVYRLGNPGFPNGKERNESSHKKEEYLYFEEEVIDLLWRSGEVPEWINISLDDVIEEHVILRLMYTDRFTDKDELLRKNEFPPFRIYGCLVPGDRVGSSRVNGKIDLNRI